MCSASGLNFLICFKLQGGIFDFVLKASGLDFSKYFFKASGFNFVVFFKLQGCRLGQKVYGFRA